MRVIRISYWKRRIDLKGKYLMFLCVILLASCGQSEQKKEPEQVEETVNEMREPLQVTVMQKGKEEKI